ncbi:hypothetical protein SAMN02799632_02551 [Acinetobacter pittii]|nr:hypothetical protein [Acinetobacter sp.]OTS14812.1 hypothetical protein CAT21_10975 [Acinetobacter pittii]SEP13634.1 hypothetical protein SAMN02799632_02551 [Acinetobacter pittii]
MNQNQDVIALHFGEQGMQDFSKNSTTPVDRQPAGMNFLSLDWTPPKLGRVRVITEKSNLEIENVISVLGTQVARRRANSNMRCDSLKSLMIINKLSKFL